MPFEPDERMEFQRYDDAFEADLDRLVAREVGTRIRRRATPKPASPAELQPVTWADIAAIVATAPCEACGGTGADCGALAEAEPCGVCLGGGVRIAGELESCEHVGKQVVSSQSSVFSPDALGRLARRRIA
jgi:hypothetical protein